MKPIQLNKQQIEAILNGASMLAMPISEDDVVWLHDTDFKYEEEIYPLQIGEEYYVQEEFYQNNNKLNKNSDIFYRVDYKSFDAIHIITDWQDASQMQPHQSRIKFKVTDNQIKRVQDISHNDGEIYDIYPAAHKDGYENFMHGFNEKFLDGKYEDNPYVFLSKLERI